MQYYNADSHVARLLEQYEAITLRPEQARELAWMEHQYDELPRADPGDENAQTLSVWEELDYRRLLFQQVLDEEQFRAFENVHQQQYATLVSENAQTNLYFVPQVNYLEALLDFATTNFLPQARRLCEYGEAVAGYRIAFLREAYRDHLAQRRIRSLVKHLWENRSYAPAGFRAINLEYDLEHCAPVFVDGFLNSAPGVRELANTTVSRTIGMRVKEKEIIDLFATYQDFAYKSRAAVQDAIEPGGWYVRINKPEKSDTEQWKELALRLLVAQAVPGAADKPADI